MTKNIISAIDVANYFIKLANSKSENDLTNLKLQKILYLAQGTTLGKKGAESPLFFEPIEAWPLGPVIRDVYNTFSICGASPITLLDIPAREQNISSEIERDLSTIWEEYGKYSAAYLVELTHRQAPWRDNFSSGSKKTIPVTDMAKFFAAAQV